MVVLEHRGAVGVALDRTVRVEQIYGQRQTMSSCNLQHIRPYVRQGRSPLQASDVMKDEEGVQGLCRQAACWLFGSPEPRPSPAPDDASSRTCDAQSEDRIQVCCHATLLA